MKILQLTSGHPRFDVRIFVKMCRSLASRHDVRLAVADGLGNDKIDGIAIIDVGKRSGRLYRVVGGSWRLFRLALTTDADVIHFHDGFFLPWGILLALMRKRVIYDVHEDYPREVMNWRFTWLIKKLVSLAYVVLESVAGAVFYRIVAATPTIATRFPLKKTVTIHNYPIVRPKIPKASNQDPSAFAYIGSIAPIRGYSEMKEAVRLNANKGLKSKLIFAGTYKSPLGTSPKTKHDDYRGNLDRDGVADLLSSVAAGLCLLYPTENHRYALPVKLFEYMEAGIPFIASDFPVWREIGQECGIFVDPLDVEAIAEAMRRIIKNPTAAREMGARGRKAIEDRFSWGRENETLQELYAPHIRP